MDSEKRFRVVEIFGPTIQGEGRHIGIPCVFVRFAGCDYRCTWCDSPHAVLPRLAAKAKKYTAEEIWRGVQARYPKTPWVVFSGGNPALFDLRDLVNLLHGSAVNVMVETQGTIYNDYLHSVDELCISPKPPSSQNKTDAGTLAQFLANFSDWWIGQNAYLKIPIFDRDDYAYACLIRRMFKDLPMFLSVGNLDKNLPTVGNNAVGDPDAPVDKMALIERMRWLMETVASDPLMRSVRVLPQLHVLAWGNERGR